MNTSPSNNELLHLKPLHPLSGMHRLKVLALVTLGLAVARVMFGQTLIGFQNRLLDVNHNVVLYAPVYGVNPVAPDVRLSGNATTNGGSTDYTGVPLLLGTTYTASLWAAPVSGNLVAGDFQLLATIPFRTNPSLAGIWATAERGVKLEFILTSIRER
jgi:hypothetical protein